MAESLVLSVVVNFFNMRREAKRTLFSLTTHYQRDVSECSYEVIVIDNGSTEPLDQEWVESFGSNFKYIYRESNSPSPCAAINYAASIAKADYLMVCIDGARLLSPSMLKYTIAALRLKENPFVYSLGMHIGHKPQNDLVIDGYDQSVEDALFNTVDWCLDGYQLFDISSVALSSKKGYFSQLGESNCFTMRRSDYLGLGGYDEQFVYAGGGVVNGDFFRRVHDEVNIQPIMLLGEATFHQFHGGVATNVPREIHPLKEMIAEYERIRGKAFSKVSRVPEYYGWISPRYHAKLISL